MKNVYFLFFVLILFSSCRDRVPIGLAIDNIIVERFPAFNSDGETWDGTNSSFENNPDIFIAFGEGNPLNETAWISSHFANAEEGLEITYPVFVEFYNIHEEYSLALFDFDLTENQLMANHSFIPINEHIHRRHKGFNYVYGNSTLNLRVRIEGTWIYD